MQMREPEQIKPRHDSQIKTLNPGQDDVCKLEYGQSITDACIDWEHSVQLLQNLSDAVQARRKVKA